jgi:DNA polymerase
MDKEVAAIARELITRLAWYRESGVEALRAPAPSATSVEVTPVEITPADPIEETLASLSVSAQDAVGRLATIREELGDCQRCKLCAHRTNIVFGSGDPSATLLFVGEGPGADEDQQGLPFVGKAGQLLTRMITAMGLTRDSVYIANVIKCRPPQNRPPEPDEVASCKPFLLQQIRAIRPRIICALGAHAAQTLLETTTPISALRGRFHPFGDRGEIQLMPTFHPAYLLRNPNAKPQTWEDLQKIMAEMKKVSSPK